MVRGGLTPPTSAGLDRRRPPSIMRRQAAAKARRCQASALQNMKKRTAKIVRNTSETKITLTLNIDGEGRARISTGIPFFDHMLTLFTKHSLVDMDLKCKGDLQVDYHHTVEDCGIALGQAFAKALGDKRGIRRYGFALLPMDDCLARVVIDFSGRPYLVYPVQSARLKAGDFPIILGREFLQGFANHAACNLHAEVIYGSEPHHRIEATFKAFAKAVDMACQRDPRVKGVPSTKGKL